MRQVPLSSHAITAVAWFDAIRIGWASGANKMPPMIMPEKNTAATIKTSTPSFRREGTDPSNCLSQKLPVAPVHGASPFAGNAHKGPAFLFAVYWLFLKKLMHKNLISELDESRHPTTYFPSLPA
jgi:hypothetical protein